MSDDFSHEEKAIDNVQLLPYCHFLWKPDTHVNNPNEGNKKYVDMINNMTLMN